MIVYRLDCLDIIRKWIQLRHNAYTRWILENSSEQLKWLYSDYMTI